LEALVSIAAAARLLALQASAREFRDRWRSGRFGNRVELFRETLRDRMRTQSNVSSRLVDDLRTELEQSGIDLYHGHGQFRVGCEFASIYRTLGWRSGITLR
jgi:hypothetical protein